MIFLHEKEDDINLCTICGRWILAMFLLLDSSTVVWELILLHGFIKTMNLGGDVVTATVCE